MLKNFIKKISIYFEFILNIKKIFNKYYIEKLTEIESLDSESLNNICKDFNNTLQKKSDIIVYKELNKSLLIIKDKSVVKVQNFIINYKPFDVLFFKPNCTTNIENEKLLVNKLSIFLSLQEDLLRKYYLLMDLNFFNKTNEKDFDGFIKKSFLCEYFNLFDENNIISVYFYKKLSYISIVFKPKDINKKNIKNNLANPNCHIFIQQIIELL